MKLTVQRDHLIPALDRCMGVLATAGRSVSSILDCVLLEASAAGLSVRTTNALASVQESLQGIIDKKGATAVDIKALRQCAAAAADSTLKLELHDSKLLVQSGARKTRMRCLPAEDYPAEVQVPDLNWRELPASEFAQAIERVAFCVTEDRPWSYGVSAEFEESGYRVVGLSPYVFGVAGPAAMQPRSKRPPIVFLPALILKPLLTSAAKVETIKIANTDQTFYGEAGQVRIASVLPPENGPPWDVLFFKQGATAKVTCAQLIGAVRAVTATGGTRIRCEFEPTQLRVVLSEKDARVEEAMDEIEADASESFRFTVDSRWLHEVLRNSGESTTVHFSTQANQVCFVADDYRAAIALMDG